MTDQAVILSAAAAALVLAACGVGYWFMRRGSRDRDAAFYHFRCPRCKRRLRFQARQVGHKGECSHCKQPVTFPPTSQSVD